MIKINKEALSSPLAIFILYILASGLVIMGFRFIFPGAPVPLAHFSIQWRLIEGFLEYLNFFPALMLTALVIPFGFKIHATEKTSRFSEKLFQTFKMHIFTAIIASTLFGLLYTLALPLARNHEANILYQSRLFLLAREKAQRSATYGDWTEALQLLSICERIWPKNEEILRLKTLAEIHASEGSLGYRHLPHTRYTRPETPTWPESSQTPDATGALVMAEQALAEERFFDAHWLATLGGRLASPGSPELATANRIAGRAWSVISSKEPTSREIQAYNNFRLKRDGYEAMLGGEWIRAYYIFIELLDLTPTDPDVARYLAISEEGVNRSAFFIDEIELTLGQILTGAIFSLPLESNRPAAYGRQGSASRLIMRVSSLSTAPDCAYGIDTEIMAFDRDGRPLWNMHIPYIKILPYNLETGPALSIFLRALDRKDQSVYWAPEITSFGPIIPGNSEITVPISWDSFLLLANVRRGISGLSAVDLRRAAETLGSCGYLPQVFEAELLERFIRPLLLLPLGILVIAIGWQYRALKRPRYMGIPMLGILPVVFKGLIHFCRDVLDNLGIWAVVTFGFTIAAILFATAIVISLVLSLIILASRHS
jgi:hypothetical protein